jgi:hypothetical protein
VINKTPRYGFSHVTKINPITDNIGTINPIVLNSFLTVVFDNFFDCIILSDKIPDKSVNSQNERYGTADNIPFFSFLKKRFKTNTAFLRQCHLSA